MNEEEQMQPWTDHLAELRKRILWVLLFFVLALALSFIYAGDIFLWITQTTIPDVKIHAFSPADTFKVYMQISFVSAIIFTLPVFLFHLWRFVSPGLKSYEKKAVRIYIPMAFFLFLGGLAFGYFLLFPLLMHFMERLANQMGVVQLFGIYQYISFMLNILLPLAFLFELPVVVLFLTRIRLISPTLLQKGRRMAYLILIIVAAILAPPDLVSNLLIALPLILLYEFSISLSRWLYRKMEKEEEKVNE